MNKKLLSLAIAGVLAGGLGVAQADVTVGGTFNMSVDYIDTPDGTGVAGSFSKKWNASSNSSNIVINGSQDLGNGMKGVAHLQQFFRLDNVNATGNRMTDGNAYVGLQTSMGLLKAGSHDSMAKLNGRAYDLFGNSLGDSRNLGIANTRASNVVAYVSPTFAGVSGVVAKVTNTDTGAATSTTTEATTILVKYAGGPVSVGLGVDAFHTPNDTQVINLGAGFNVGPAKIVAMVQQTDNIADVNGDEQSVMGVGASMGFGNSSVKAQVYMVTDTVSNVETEAQMIAIGYDYAFSKAFKGYVVFAQSDDDAGGTTYGMAGGGHGDNPVTAMMAGQKMNGLGIGANISF